MHASSCRLCFIRNHQTTVHAAQYQQLGVSGVLVPVGGGVGGAGVGGGEGFGIVGSIEGSTERIREAPKTSGSNVCFPNVNRRASKNRRAS